ncbi:hypothetical protein [Cupriavidus sp. SW-Y-13]|uniref:hypothetical protein n=1 Tax=Cupriavidus sp. SW-Y-13 TaxID=2653854 RepID=UPI0013666A08|nr:hypothetical protein [Cupriavidus sp. SW-Y-13]MWL87683.1 hypothetical protein [Cupriavidus sp. SW-Y-13]
MIAQEEVEDIVGRLQEELKLPNGFFQKLRDEDDWSFVIKLHAMLEAALGHVIVHRLGYDALADAVSYMDMSDKRKGKVVIAAALGMLVSHEITYCDVLSELRNVCAHDIRESVAFDLVKTCAAMKPSQRGKFIKGVCGDDGNDKIEVAGRATTRSEVALENPKWALWHIGMYVLAHLCLQKETEALRRQYDEAVKKGYDSLVKQREQDTGRSSLLDALILARTRQEQEQAGSQNKEAL